jgi:glycosyltransferase involved in cell wall biosynthesis
MNKILIFIPEIDFGGAERVLVTLANEFYRLGKEVIFVTRKEYNCDEIKLNPQIKIISIPIRNPLKLILKLSNIINKYEPNEALSALDNGNLYLLISKFFVYVKINFHVSIHSNVSQNSKVENSAKSRFARFLLAYLYKKANSIIAVSQGVKNDFEFIYGNNFNIKVIYNPVVNEHMIRQSGEMLGDLKKLFQRNFVITAVGRFVEAKNFQLLIESFALVNSRTTSVLILVGDGPLFELYKKTIFDLNLDKNVIFTGFIDNPYKYMKASDLFVLSSNYEGLPTVLIEAMACGTKVVSTDCPSGPREILEDGMWGTLVPVGDKYALANAMYESLFNLNPPNVLKRANDFTTEIAAKKYLEHFGFIQ